MHFTRSDIQVGWLITSNGSFAGEQKVIAINFPEYQVADGTWINWENIQGYRQGPWDMETFGK
ncbi:uncharacterized protein N7484_005279 [Penicillium longicatenatum]|uniref:uncharacterized protein n=1 Tax=Penicillium longicatenatum TaxID=1561947 RepID=UPI0025489CF1|nr:uncharacterized protein N7484_005279 [Penicillium longicatenatum]KAJ5651556.1 hypothetical protein N7484_005279 [Penicillium longicatenatum]